MDTEEAMRRQFRDLIEDLGESPMLGKPVSDKARETALITSLEHGISYREAQSHVEGCALFLSRSNYMSAVTYSLSVTGDTWHTYRVISALLQSEVPAITRLTEYVTGKPTWLQRLMWKLP